MRLASRALVAPLVVGSAFVAACGTRTPLRCERPIDAEIEPPTFYFVFDRSRSMRPNDSDPRVNKWRDVRAGAADVVRALGPRARVAAATFPGPEGCDPGVEAMPATFGGDATADLLLTLTAGTPEGGTPIASTLRALTPRFLELRDAFGPVVVVLVSDGGPNCNRALSCGVERCTPNMDGSDPRCPRWGPASCCTNDLGGAEACLDDDGAVDAVAALAKEDVKLYVVGVPGSEPFAEVMNRMAIVSGTGRPEPPHYYSLGSTQSATLRRTFDDIVLRAERSCDVRLKGGAPASLEVYLDDAVVPRDASNGWVAKGDHVVLRGKACALREAGARLRPVWRDECAR
jgi:hypothetical protein